MCHPLCIADVIVLGFSFWVSTYVMSIFDFKYCNLTAGFLKITFTKSSYSRKKSFEKSPYLCPVLRRVRRSTRDTMSFLLCLINQLTRG